jgi:hypothetical protein
MIIFLIDKNSYRFFETEINKMRFKIWTYILGFLAWNGVYVRSNCNHLIYKML